MAASRPLLSKSRLMSAWQCPKRLHLETHHPELGDVTARTESLFATGHEVGQVAQRLYGTPLASTVPYQRRMQLMVAQTQELLAERSDRPIFEATFEHDGVLVRVDVLRPDDAGWRIIEVKASTSVKDYHLLDCAIQDWVLQHTGVNVTGVSLAHVNNQFVYPGAGDYAGLLTEVDVTNDIRALFPTVVELVGAARKAVRVRVPKVRVGTQCNKPFECQFMRHCWPTETEYPITGLGGSKAKLADYVARGYTDIRDVDPAIITADTQLRIHRVTQSGAPELLPDARQELQSLGYPRYYLDFETIGPAVPFWEGTRPYAPVPVQWSCHIDDGCGTGAVASLRHEEFLDLSGAPPMRQLAEALIACLGDTGPILMYTNYEQTVIQGLIDLFPDLAEPLNALINRLFDLFPIVKTSYYHPDMLGSWSIKAVLPTIVPDMNYDRLEGIKEGTGASDGFIEAINPETSAARKSDLRDQLLRYCRFDTEAMVEIVRFFCGSR